MGGGENCYEFLVLSAGCYKEPIDMIKSLIEIGSTLKEKYHGLFALIQKPYENVKEEPKVLVVEFNTKKYLYIEGFYLETYSAERNQKRYFFKEPFSSQGAASSLCFKLPATFSALKQRLTILNKLGYKVEDMNLVAKEIDKKVEEFKQRGSIDKNTSVLVVLKIDGKWPAENPILLEKMESIYLDELSTYKNKKVWKQRRARCHLCGRDTEVFGGVGSLLKFYTVDKFGYAPDLSPEFSWKQYALCRECIFNLERGLRATEEFLSYYFYGKKFWLLPTATNRLDKVLDHFKNFHGKVYKEGYESIEDRLLYEAALQQNVISYHFVFTKKTNQKFEILLHIDEVLPSVLKQYIETKNNIERDFVLSTGYEIKFNFLSSKSLKSQKDYPGFTDKDFFMFVDHVFRKSFIDEIFVISKAMSRIRKDMVNILQTQKEKIPKFSVLEVFLSLEFFLKFGILRRKIGGKIMSDSGYRDFFKQYDDFFNHPAKRGLVLFGVLIQKFLNYQLKERDSTPFLKVLKNLRLTQKDVENAFVALQNKMQEYNVSHWWRDLKKSIALNFVEAGENWNFSPDEIGFYIAIGMSLYSLPIFGREENNSEGGEDVSEE